MPLMKGKSEKAFSHNVAAEMDSGKPQKQSLAIAYAMKRKKKAMGGEMEQDTPGVPMDDDQKKAAKSISKGFKKALGYAEGGKCRAHDMEGCEMCMSEGGFIGEEKASGYDSHEGNDVKSNHRAMAEDDRDLNQHGEDEEGPYGLMMSEGGMLTDRGYQSEEDEDDMVGEIIKHRAMHYSKGGRVANDTPPVADFEENDFDDLALRDDLDSSYTGANSGDELGNKRTDDDEDDIIREIMASRRKKDRLPRPA